MLGVKLVDFIARCLVVCRLSSELRFGVFWLPCKVALKCTLALTTLMWSIMFLALLLVGGLPGPSLWSMMVICCSRFSR